MVRDLICASPLGERLLLDVSVTHPAAPTSSRRPLRPLVAAQQREREKVRKYGELATMEHATFIPLVVESTGALSLATLD